MLESTDPSAFKNCEEVPPLFTNEVAVVVPETLIPEELIVTAEPTVTDEAVTTPTVMFGVPVSP